MSAIDAVDNVREPDVRLGAVRLTMAAGSDQGLRYPANFDVLHVDPVTGLVVVADGMGAGRGSALAGSTTVKVFVSEVTGAAHGETGATLGESGVTGPAALRAAVAEVQRRVCAAGARLGELTGCTLTALVPGGADGSGADGVPQAWIVQVGDSRVYRLRAGVLELLTVDHTVAWLGAVYGWYPADSADAAADRYRLNRFIGHPDLPEPDILNVSLRPGDIYCVCTDGLAEQVSYDRLNQVLGSGAHPREMVPVLLADALAAGGRDNATVAIVRVGSAGA